MTNRINCIENYTAEVVADSISEHGHRLTSVEVNLPRMVLAELNTHRMFSRNSASSRAIPTHRRLTEILDNPFIPAEWGRYKTGMSSEKLLTEQNQAKAEQMWLRMRDQAVLGTVALMGGLDSPELTERAADELVPRLQELQEKYDYEEQLEGEALHKQWVNRPLEPFMWHKVLITATEWDNFMALRISEFAQPEINLAALAMKTAMESSQPTEIAEKEFHAPYIQLDEQEELQPIDLAKIGTARSARLSYETQGRRFTPEEEFGKHDNLVQNGHMSPTEHVATPFTKGDMEWIEKALADSTTPEWRKKGLDFDGNFRGYHQYRKQLACEDNYGKVIAAQAG